jgi:hypothetical protein
MSKPRLLMILALVVLVVGVGVAGVAIGGQRPIPWRVLTHYSWDTLVEEAHAMDECAECHETEDFHTCTTCHDDHGAVELADIPFYAVIELTGDVPEPGYVPINEILPYRDQPNTHVSLLDWLGQVGVTEFESVTLASRDEGFVTVERQYLTAEAMLMPYEDGIRFAAVDLHGSTWLKGVTRIIVVGVETPLQIDGQATSIGRLLVGPTRAVTVEQAEVMLKSETDGQVRRGKTASRLEGAPVESIVANPSFRELVMRDSSGREHTLTAQGAQGAVLALVRGAVTLVLPDRGRGQWIADVVDVASYE